MIPVLCFLLSFLRCLLVSLPGVMDEIQRMLFGACLETFNFLLVVVCSLLVVRGLDINFNCGKFFFFTIDTGKLQKYLALKLNALHIFDQKVGKRHDKKNYPYIFKKVIDVRGTRKKQSLDCCVF